MEPNTFQSIADLFSIGRILSSAAILLLTWALIKLLYSLTWLMTRRFLAYRLRIIRFFPVVRMILWAAATYIIVVLIFRPQANAVLALAASLGIAIGLALQDLAKNILSGILILVDQPFRVGDMIRAGDHYGEVISIGIRSVQLHTFDDSIVSLPNSSVIGQAVSNSNAGELSEMVVVHVDLPATVDVRAVKQLAWEAAASSPFVYMKKPIAVTVEDRFERTFLTRFNIKAYVSDIRLERVMASDVTQRLKHQLVEQGTMTEELITGVLNSPAPVRNDTGIEPGSGA